MLGWEFPPFITGGVGVHCKNLTKELADKGVKITYVIPKRSSDVKADYMDVINIEGKELYIYNSNQASHELRSNVANFIFNVINAVKDLNYDIIHCHEWVTFDAGVKLKELTGKPLVVSCHATEYDRTPHNPWNMIINKERNGLEKADKIITVSNMMKNTIVEKYSINSDKINVIYNAVNINDFKTNYHYTNHNKLVLFVGRLFVQKGIEFFLRAAKKVLEYQDNVDFVIIGSGDLIPQLVNESISLGIQDHVFFTGYISEEEKKKYYAASDVFVMPSISEPFGITALEAAASKVPLIISKNSGCSEVINHCLKTDFWDIHKMAEYILSVLDYDGLSEELADNAYNECTKLTWNNVAEETKKIYEGLV